MELIEARRPASGHADRILKVNHAGEHGAVNIYAGQRVVARFTARQMLGELAEFHAHERKHRGIFQAELKRRGVRRCRSYLLCGVGGYALGVITALMGSRAIAATTVAVEQVVLRHLERQLEELGGSDPAACDAIRSTVEEDRLHHDRSSGHLQGREMGIGLRVLAWGVERCTEAVIALGMRL